MQGIIGRQGSVPDIIAGATLSSISNQAKRQAEWKARQPQTTLGHKVLKGSLIAGAGAGAGFLAAKMLRRRPYSLVDMEVIQYLKLPPRFMRAALRAVAKPLARRATTVRKAVRGMKQDLGNYLHRASKVRPMSEAWKGEVVAKAGLRGQEIRLAQTMKPTREHKRTMLGAEATFRRKTRNINLGVGALAVGAGGIALASKMRKRQETK